MKWFADSSIRGKLIAIQLLTTLAGLALYGAFTAVNETRLHRAALVRKSEVLAQMIATNCTSPLDFHDTSAAEETLASAEADEDVVNAWIYGADGELFATYARPSHSLFNFPRRAVGVYPLEDGFLTVSSPMTMRGEQIGIASVRLTTVRFRSVMVRSGILAGVALALGMAVSLFLSLLLQRAISRPIRALVGAIKRVSETGDYATRINADRRDEIGALCGGFDEMLQTLSQRESERNEAEMTLRMSEQKYRELVENANSIILRWNPEGRITFLNEFGQRFFGYSEAEILGQHVVGSLVPITESTGRDMRPLLEQISSDPKAFERNINENVRRNGERVWVDWTNKVAFDDRGNVEGILSIGTDITERRRAESALRESETRYRGLFEDCPVSLWEEDFSAVKSYIDALLSSGVTDLGGYLDTRPDSLRQCADLIRVLDVNRATLDLLRYERREDLCAHLSQVLRSESYDLLREELVWLASGNTVFQTETVNHSRTGERLDVTMMVAIVPGHETTWSRVFVSITDISSRVRAEEELRELNTALEHRVNQRTAELALAKERAESADRLKSAFLASMSHELRTPLNSIIGFTGIVLQGLPGPLNPEQTKQLSMVQASARHLLALINDVLDLSKIEAGQLEVEVQAFDARASIERVLGLVAPLAEKKGLTVSARVSPEVGELASDRRRFEQILINLINNGLKFTERGYVQVECAVNDGMLVTRVADSGMGIKPEDMGKLFQAFQQIDVGLSRSHEGTGLGLSICKRLIEKMGGEIAVESQWGVGSVFTFTLPLVHG